MSVTIPQKPDPSAEDEFCPNLKDRDSAASCTKNAEKVSTNTAKRQTRKRKISEQNVESKNDEYYKEVSKAVLASLNTDSSDDEKDDDEVLLPAHIEKYLAKAEDMKKFGVSSPVGGNTKELIAFMDDHTKESFFHLKDTMMKSITRINVVIKSFLDLSKRIENMVGEITLKEVDPINNVVRITPDCGGCFLHCPTEWNIFRPTGRPVLEAKEKKKKRRKKQK